MNCKPFLSLFSFNVAIVCLLLLSAPLKADTVTLYDGKQLEGRISDVNEKTLTITLLKPPKKRVTVKLFDVVRYRIQNAPQPQNKCLLLIDGWKNNSDKPLSGKVKLKKGFHRVYLPYLHTTGSAKLKVSMGRDVGKKISELSTKELAYQNLYRVHSELRSKGSKIYDVDKKGFRLAIDMKGMKLKQEHGIACRLIELKPIDKVEWVHDIRLLSMKKYYRSNQFKIPSITQRENFALVYEALVTVPADGEYTFSIETDKNSLFRFYMGTVPPPFYGQAMIPKKEDWNVKLTQQGKLLGSIKSWGKEQAGFEVTITSKKRTLLIKTAIVEELWRANEKELGTEKINREEEPTDSDSLYANNKSNKIQRVSGKILGFKEGKVQFLFRDVERQIDLKKIVGIVLKKKKPASSSKTPSDFSSMVQLLGPHRIPGLLQLGKDKKFVLKMADNQKLILERKEIAFADMQNARLQLLTAMKPNSVEQIPFFNRINSFQIDKSLNGKSLQIGNKVYQHGLCVHSRTVLNYSLNKQFEKFQCDIGLQHQTGRLGNVAVKILVDEKVLYEKKEFTMQDKPIPVNLNVSGKVKLTLIVDYGKGQDVGDRFVWGNPQLIRNALDSPNGNPTTAITPKNETVK